VSITQKTNVDGRGYGWYWFGDDGHAHGPFGSYDVMDAHSCASVRDQQDAADLRINPAYYKLGNIEVIDVIEGWNLPYHIGNAVKYVCRAGNKGEEEAARTDLRKAAWYLRRFAANYLVGQEARLQTNHNPDPDMLGEDWGLEADSIKSLFLRTLYGKSNAKALFELACMLEVHANKSKLCL
jgi:hypothetical protein